MSALPSQPVELRPSRTLPVFLAHLIESFRKPDHWLYGSWLDVITHHRKNYFGLVWILVPTAVYIWGIGGYMGALNPGMKLDVFLAHMAFGFVMYRFASTVALESTNVFSGYKAYIDDGNQRLTDFILRRLSSSIIHLLFALPLLGLVLIMRGEILPPLGVFISVIGLLLVVINLLLWSTVLSLFGARFPDVSELAGSAVLAGFLITPIVWYPDLAPAGTVRGMLMRANPFHHVLAVVREPTLGQPVEPLTWYYLAAMTVLGLVCATIGYGRFARRVPAWL